MQAASIQDVSSLSPNYSFIFNFEQSFEHLPKRVWMQENWHQAFYWVAVYMILVFGGQAYMSNRQPFKLKKQLAIWNIIFATFSIAGTLRTLPELIHVMKTFGFFHSICNSSYIEVTRVSGFWTWCFALSKALELGDTLFIVLRKRNLIFLHWYHHITVLLFTWYSYGENISVARWYICMNYLVHSAMYSYYALRTFEIRIPKIIPMLITASQIIQMVAGFYVTYYAYTKVTNGSPCRLSEGTAKLGLIMYGSYFVLFAQFFLNSYGPKTNKGTSYANSKAKAN